LSCNGQALLLEGVDEWRIVHALRAFPPGEDQRIFRGIPSEAKRSALADVEIYIALQLNPPRDELAARDHYPASAGFHARSNRGMERFGVVGLVVTFGAILGNLKFPRWELGRLDARKNSRYLVPHGSRTRGV